MESEEWRVESGVWSVERLEGDSFILTGSARECKGRLFETAIRVRDKRRLIPQGRGMPRPFRGAFAANGIFPRSCSSFVTKRGTEKSPAGRSDAGFGAWGHG